MKRDTARRRSAVSRRFRPIHLSTPTSPNTRALRRSFWLAPVAALVLCFTACSPITHDEELAKKRALEFAEVAIIRPDVERAYAQLSEGAKRYVSVEKFRETLSRLHSDGHPARVSVTGYKPMFNEKAIYIFLAGEGSGKEFQYILTLEGTAASDYKVSIITRTS